MKTGKVCTAISLFLTVFPIGGIEFANAGTKILRPGVVLRLGDKFNDSVESLQQGIEVAKDVFQSRNPGVKIELRNYSHTEILDTLVAAADQIEKNGTPAVVGAEMSDEAIVLGDQLAKKGIPLVTGTASNPKVTEGKPHVFRVGFADDQVAEKIARFVYSKWKPKSLGVLHGVASPYPDYLGRRFIEVYTNLLKKDGAKPESVILQRKFLDAHLDFSQEIQAFKNAGVTHVVALTYQSDFSRFVVQSANKGFQPIYVGSDGWGSSQNIFRSMVKENPSGAKFVAYRNSYWKEDTNTPLARAFRSAYETRFKGKPNAWVAISFDAAWVLFHAMNRAKDPSSPDQIRAELSRLKNIEVVTAPQFRFGGNNSPDKELYLYRIDAQGIHYEATLP